MNKMKKRLFALFSVAVIVVSSAMGVFAKEHPSASNTVVSLPNTTTDDENYYVIRDAIEKLDSFIALQKIVPEMTDLILKVNSGEITPQEFLDALMQNANVSDAVKNGIKNKEMLYKVFDVDKVNEPKKVNGKYRVTMKIPAVTAKTTGLGLVHLTSAGEWEYLDPVKDSTDLKKQTATFDFDGFSPVFLVADKGTADTSSTSKPSGSSQSTSPKTSQTSDWMTWAVMAVLFAGAGVVLRKKAK